MDRRLAVRLVVLVAAALVATAGCGAVPPPTTGPSPAPPTDAPPMASPGTAPPTTAPAADVAIVDVARLATTRDDAVAAAAAVNAFGLDLYRAMAAGTGNAVVSPASIALALAMARAGARGETAAQMDAVLRRFGADELAAWPAALGEALAERSGTFRDASGADLEVALRIANAPFAQRDLPLEAAYLEALGARFGAGLRLVDYVAATEEARRTINAWVGEQTEQRIPELLVPGILSPDTRLTLVNAIYLKAPLLTPFDEGTTAPAPFTRLDGSTVDVPMMASSGELRYAAGDGWQAVELPYLGRQLAMTVVVPDDLAAFEAGLDAPGLASIIGALAAQPVRLWLPRFGIETTASLADALRALGMPLAFDPDRADFSGITGSPDLFISDVVHQANIDVDEEGTEAAAATGVVMDLRAAALDPVTVRADRPFLFALRDVPTGAVLFLGRVTDPSIAR
jgi:serpin B